MKGKSEMLGAGANSNVGSVKAAVTITGRAEFQSCFNDSCLKEVRNRATLLLGENTLRSEKN